MTDKGNNSLHTSVLIIGAGPSGLAAAITIKKNNPQLEVCVIDKAEKPGHHNISGAVLEPKAIEELLSLVREDWKESNEAGEILSRKVEQDNLVFLPGGKLSFGISAAVKLSKVLGFDVGESLHGGDYIVSVSKLSKWLCSLAVELGVEVYHGFAASEIVFDEERGIASGVKLVDQGYDREGSKLVHFRPGEVISCDCVLIAEGCDGNVTETFVKQAGLRRDTTQVYSVGIKEIIEVDEQHYQKFGDNRVVHSLGYPLWRPLLGPDIFGGGIMYSNGDNRIVVGIIAGCDWQEHDFNPQDALTLYKQHPYVSRYIEGGEVVEAGARLIPEGGFRALPRYQGSIGRGNVVILGDSAGFVNMIKIKGLHNAIRSGMAAGKAVTELGSDYAQLAADYTKRLDGLGVTKDMKMASNFRQTIARFGNTFGLGLSVFSKYLPSFNVEEDYQRMTSKKYQLKPEKGFDKDAFTAFARVHHREDQPTHCLIKDPAKCVECKTKYNQPCVLFCPAGVYEDIHGELKSANASNCLHCKTCQRKCPYNNLQWTPPEGGGGPRYRAM